MKKLLILFLCIAMCFLSACMPESTETTSGTTTSDLSDHNDLPEGTNSDLSENRDSGDSHPTVVFRSVKFLKEVLIATNGTKEEYNAFRSQVPSSFKAGSFSTYHKMKNFKEKILANDFPFLREGTQTDDFSYIYYPTLDKFEVCYKIDGVIYRFTYRYEPFEHTPTTDCAIKDYQIGSYSVDLFPSEDISYYYGIVMLDHGVLIIQLSLSDNLPPDAKDLFEFKPLELSSTPEPDDETTDFFDPSNDPLPVYNGSYHSMLIEGCACELSLPIEADPWKSAVEKKTVGTTATIEVFGEKLTGVYQDTHNRRFENAIVDRYIALDHSYWFELDVKDGTLKAFQRLKHDFGGKADVVTSSNQAVAIAKELASTYIQDMSNCDFIVHSGITTGDGMSEGIKYEYNQYAISYRKMIDGYETSAYFYMTLSSKGTLESLHIADVNAYAGLNELQIDEAEVIKSIEYCIKKGYCENEYFKTLGYTIGAIECDIKRIVSAPDGTLYVETDVRITVKIDGETQTCLGTLLTEIGIFLNIN